ncbi:MAG: efflux RND transporter permease subunit [bacterium]|nr:efflux RND transporter permease subunit [bacterium]
MKRMIAVAAENPVFANLLMAILIIFGVGAIVQIKSELVPQFSLDRVQVAVTWEGASPEEVEEGLCIKIEEALTSVEGVKQITSTALEHRCVVVAELESWVKDLRKTQDDIKDAVDQIDTFPDEIERPVVTEVKRIDQVLDIAVYGNVPEVALKRIAEEIKDDLIEMRGVSQVVISGLREWEIAIEVSEATLRQYGLTFSGLADIIRKNVLELSGGDIRSPERRIRIRTLGKRYTGREFENLVILTRKDGTILRLGEIARVVDGFEDTDQTGRFNGKPAALIVVNKTEEEDALGIAKAVKAYVERKRKELPRGVEIAHWADTSRMIEDRLDLLLRNGRLGLVLVFLSLWLFLNIRLSFWVAMGIPVALMAALGFLNFVGGTLNMLSMFAFIMVLGILVDDAIVVAENIYTKFKEGRPFLEAAIEGAYEVAWPVVGTVTTTIAAFVPLMMVEGTIGKFMAVLPVVVIASLIASLIESLFILPAHLADWLRLPREGTFSSRLRARIDGRVEWTIHRTYAPAVRFCLEARYLVAAAAVAVFVITLGLAVGGHVRFLFFPKFDADWVEARLIFPEGTPIEQTANAAKRIEVAAKALNMEFKTKTGEPAVKHVFSLLGVHVTQNRTTVSGSHVTHLIVELLPSERRGFSSNELVNRWRELTGLIPDTISLTFGGVAVRPSGKPIEVQFAGDRIADLRAAAAALKAELKKYPGVQDIEDDFRPSKLELRAALKPQARVLGVTLQDLALQLRAGFFGLEVLRLQRGRDDVKVKLRYPPEERRALGDVENMRIRTGTGVEIPFSEVADVQMTRGLSEIKRIDRRRVIAVTAEIDEAKANPTEILGALQKTFFPQLLRSIPGVRVRFEGQAKDTRESLGSLFRGFLIAAMVIYGILATLFRSYFQPLIVMSAIPFGFVGAVWGHILMGYDISMMSLLGVVALSGVVVNDSLVLLDFVNRFISRGTEVHPALVQAGISRFRPIVLTTLTTAAGLGPMIFERSFQAQFLIPMALSLCFGLLFATVITLVLVPVFSLIGNDIVRGLHRLWGGRWPSREEVDVHWPGPPASGLDRTAAEG